MKKILIKINKEKELLYPTDGYILGVLNYGLCFEKMYTIDEIKKIRLENKNILYASLNRPIFNSELDEYKKTLKSLDNIGLDGIIVGDVAALTYDLKTPIILDQLHLNNSSLTVNHYFNNGGSGIFLTNDITLDEINNIKEKNRETLIFKQVFGYAHLSTSVRSLVTNYLKYFDKKSNDNVFKIKETNNEDSYIITEDYFGTHILSNKVLNLIDKIDLIKADFLVLDSYLINDDITFVLNAFNKKDISKKNNIDKTFNCDEGFINKKTIYRVKKND